MKDFLLSLEFQARNGVKLGSSVRLSQPKKIQKILFCGMGGSAIGGDIIREAGFSSSKIPFFVHRASTIPSWVDQNTLVILSSYSGNTQEVLDACKKAAARKPQFLILTSGGQLAEIAKKKKISHAIVPSGMPPRGAVGYMTFPLLVALKTNKFAEIGQSEIEETLRMLGKSPASEAAAIARKLSGKSVHFYAVTGPMQVVVSRWRAQLAENSKMLASGFLMPEMFHNEIEGWRFPKSVIKDSAAVFFLDEDDPAWIEKKRKAVMTLIENQGGSCLALSSRGKSILARIFSMIQLGDWVSYELANLQGIDPIAIPAIESIKKIH